VSYKSPAFANPDFSPESAQSHFDTAIAQIARTGVLTDGKSTIHYPLCF
jgi:hypothetical protein